MNTSRAWLAGVVSAAVLGGCATAEMEAREADSTQGTVYRGLLADSVIANWPPLSAQAARRLLEQYGTPDAVRNDSLVWNHAGPWKRTTVWDVTPPYVQAEDLGVVEQTIDYPLTPRQVVELAMFDRKVNYDPDRRELSARSDREEGNFLRMNLADDVAHGRATPEHARGSYALILRLEASGKTSSYLRGLQFPAR